MTVGKYLLKYV